MAVLDLKVETIKPSGKGSAMVKSVERGEEKFESELGSHIFVCRF